MSDKSKVVVSLLESFNEANEPAEKDYKQIFIDYCKGKIADLSDYDFEDENEYPIEANLLFKNGLKGFLRDKDNGDFGKGAIIVGTVVDDAPFPVCKNIETGVIGDFDLGGDGYIEYVVAELNFDLIDERLYEYMTEIEDEEWNSEWGRFNAAFEDVNAGLAESKEEEPVRRNGPKFL